jgi:hypothetical protein
MTHPRIRTGLAVLALAAGSMPAVAGTFPTIVTFVGGGAPNTTAWAGAPDDVYAGVGGGEVTDDFGLNRALNRGGLVDLNVYEVDFGAVEFAAMTILVSQDGITYTDVKASEVPLVRIRGDSVHVNNNFGRSYDLGALDWVRYVRIDGAGLGTAGGSNGFDLGAIGAHEVVAVPEPGTWALMLGGLAAVGSLVRRRRG